MGDQGSGAPISTSAAFEWRVLDDGSGTLTAPMLRELHEYWQSLRRGRPLPARSDVDPAAIKRMLPFLFMLDVSYEPLRFRYRLYGTGLVEFTGRDVTGKFVDKETYGAALEPVYRFFQTPVETRGPVGGRGRAVWTNKREWHEVESLVLPTSSHGDSVDILLGADVSIGRSKMNRDETDRNHFDRIEIIPAPRFAAPTIS